MICRFVFGCVAACLLVGCGSNSTETTATGTNAGTSATAAEKRHQGSGFSLEVPSGWTVFSPPGSFTIYPNGGSGDASMSIVLEKYAPNMTPDQFLAHEKESAALQQGGIESSDVQLAGHPAFRRVFVWAPDKGSQADRIYYYIAAPNGVCKVFGTVNKADDFAKYLPIYEQIVQSIKID